MNRPQIRNIPRPVAKAPGKAATVGQVRTKSEKFDGVTIHSVELEFCASTDLAEEFMQILGSSVAGNGDIDVASVARQFVGGRLTALLPQLLAATTVIVPGVGQFDLNTREALNDAFAGRKRLIFPAVKLALEVSFADFLDGFELVGLPRPRLPWTKRTPSPIEDSPESMSDTGSDIASG